MNPKGSKEKPEVKRFSMDDLPKPQKTALTLAEKVIDKLSRWQLFVIILCVIVAYVISKWVE